MKIALCTNYVSPYRLPVFRELGSKSDIDLKIYTCSSGGHDRDWDRYDLDGTIRVKQSFSFSWLAKQRVGCAQSEGSEFIESTSRQIPIGLIFDLFTDRPDVIVTGELGARTLIAKIAGFIMGVPVVPWCYPSSVPLNISKLRERFRRSLLKSSPAVIGMGQTARKALAEQGAAAERIFNAPNTADTQMVVDIKSKTDFKQQARKRKSELVGDKKMALVVGRLVPMKAPLEVVHAWKNLSKSIRDEWDLVFVGDGSLRNQVDTCENKDIHFVGNVSPDLVMTYFEACDLHIFASLGDPWGLVVNEAMHHAKPTLCSIHAGCCEDLIYEGETGFRFDPLAQIESVTTTLDRVLRRSDLAKIGREASTHIAQYTPSNMADGIRNAVVHATARKELR
jgi:glycosyltransferase involved in cell wall biosynthesis